MKTPLPILPFPKLLGGLIAIAAVVGCGGGGDDSGPVAAPNAGNTVPAGALASTTAFSEFVADVVRSGRRDALDLTGVEPPVSDSDAPIPVS